MMRVIRDKGIYAIFATILWMCPLCHTIDCYKCISLNWDNRACNDPFHTNYTTGILESPCMGGRKGRNGLFPATACIKLTGKYGGDYFRVLFSSNVLDLKFVVENGTQITIRGCALDSGTLTTDTEIVRMSHCGGFYYNDRYVRGCLQSCNDADGCNRGQLQEVNLFTCALLCISFAVYGII